MIEAEAAEKCKNISCPYMCKYGFCGIEVQSCSFELFSDRLESVKIHPSAYVRSNTIIEKNVEIAEMACIGSRGMTLKRDKNKYIHWRRKDSDYPVILQKSAYIGARSIIMRGTKWSTQIGKNTFLSANVSIGHDVIVGDSCIILNGTIICGSAQIKDFTYIAPGCLIRDNITIGKESFIGLGSLVLKDVKAGTTVYGRPAKEVKNYVKNPYGL